MGCTASKKTVIESKEIPPAPVTIHIDEKLKEALIARHEAKRKELLEKNAEREEQQRELNKLLHKKTMEAPLLDIESNKLYRSRSKLY